MNIHTTLRNLSTTALLFVTAGLAATSIQAQRVSLLERNNEPNLLLADIHGLDGWALLAWVDGTQSGAAITLGIGAHGVGTYAVELPPLSDELIGRIDIGMVSVDEGRVGISISRMSDLVRSGVEGPAVRFHRDPREGVVGKATMTVPSGGHSLKVVEMRNDDGIVTVRVVLGEPKTTQPEDPQEIGLRFVVPDGARVVNTEFAVANAANKFAPRDADFRLIDVERFDR